MFNHPHSPGGGYEGGTGGDVDGVGTITASSRGIHEALSGDREGTPGMEEGTGGAGNVGESFAAGTDVSQQSSDMDIVILPHRQRSEDLNGLIEGGLGDIKIGFKRL